jgi:hypothetical protein
VYLRKIKKTFATVRLTDLDKLNLVKFPFGGLVISQWLLNQFLLLSHTVSVYTPLQLFIAWIFNYEKNLSCENGDLSSSETSWKN